jgi:hypothetical protein
MVIEPIDTTNEGPQVPKGEKGWQSVHLRQGSMDGACGLYSLMMGLIICGVVRYDDACSLSAFSSKSKIGRLFEYFANLSPLLIEGTNADHILTAINKYFPGKIDFQKRERERKRPDLVKFIDKHIINNDPVLLILTYEGGAHWVLVIGRECEKIAGKTTLCRFLILDPSEDTSKICSWNGVIETRKQKGKYPYSWWPKEFTAQLECAIALSPKKHK